MEAVGKYDFDASKDHELSFKKGDVLKILSSHDNWYKAEMHGMEGFVPQNYIEVQIPRWFQENASRTFAEEFLMTKGMGEFLIRGSQSSHGNFSISVKHEHDVQHFKVMKDGNGQYFLWSEKFCSFNKLVEFYKTASISKQKLIYLNDGIQDSKSGITTKESKEVGLQEPPKQSVIPGRRVGGGTAVPAPAAMAQRKALQVRALYNFKAEEDDELEFSAGDVIEVIECPNALWWKGRLHGRCGLFPYNYTTQL